MPGNEPEKAFATVRVYLDTMSAHMDQARLDDAGIPAFVRGETGATWMGLAAQVPGGIRLDVPTEHADEARAVLGIEADPELGTQ
jgi:hypothetical protein